MNDPAKGLLDALATIAPGRPLREGIDRILRAHRGTLVVIGDDHDVLSVCSGGFLLDAEFSPQRLSELAKMDGAIILAKDASRIARANVQLMPKSSVPTTETGTRHRTAERVARSLGVTVISVSSSMSTITIYCGDQKRTVQAAGWLIERAGQALATLQGFRGRFNVAVNVLSTLEIEDSVTVRDVVATLQSGERILRLAAELDEIVIELGVDGRLVGLQLEEAIEGVEATLELIVRDYMHQLPGARGAAKSKGRGLPALHTLSGEQLRDPDPVAEVLGFDPAGGLDSPLEPRGYRILHRLPRFPEPLIDRIVERFGTLPGLMGASLPELEKVGGVGVNRARAVKDGLARLVEASILERYG